MRTSTGASLRGVRLGARLCSACENDCSASAAAGTWSDECARAAADASVLAATVTGRMVQATLCAATTALGSHGVMAMWCVVGSIPCPSQLKLHSPRPLFVSLCVSFSLSCILPRPLSLSPSLQLPQDGT